jgi:hypothetical protein
MSGDMSEIFPRFDPDNMIGIKDWRATVERANEVRAAERLARIEALRSPLLAIEERVRLWEALHELRLPGDPRHGLLRVIARDTALAVDELHAEQQRRKSPAKSG